MGEKSKQYKACTCQKIRKSYDNSIYTRAEQCKEIPQTAARERQRSAVALSEHDKSFKKLQSLLAPVVLQYYDVTVSVAASSSVLAGRTSNSICIQSIHRNSNKICTNRVRTCCSGFGLRAVSSVCYINLFLMVVLT